MVALKDVLLVSIIVAFLVGTATLVQVLFFPNGYRYPLSFGSFAVTYYMYMNRSPYAEDGLVAIVCLIGFLAGLFFFILVLLSPAGCSMVISILSYLACYSLCRGYGGVRDSIKSKRTATKPARRDSQPPPKAREPTINTRGKPKYRSAFDQPTIPETKKLKSKTEPSRSASTRSMFSKRLEHIQRARLDLESGYIYRAIVEIWTAFETMLKAATRTGKISERIEVLSTMVQPRDVRMNPHELEKAIRLAKKAYVIRNKYIHDSVSEAQRHFNLSKEEAKRIVMLLSQFIENLYSWMDRTGKA